MKNTVLFFTILFLFFSTELISQNGFQFKDSERTKQRTSFKLINNLIVIPLEINGKKLSFILDSGIGKTILFNLADKDSIGLNEVETVELQGLGGGRPVDAFLSQNNKISLKNIESTSEKLYVVLKDDFDLSAKMGITINGIIGYNLLRDFIVKVNYGSKKIDFYHRDKYEYPNCKKCEVFPIRFYRKKPFVSVQVQLDTIGNTLTEVKLLVDSGGSDAIWLFEDTNENIKTPKLFFKDILGEGLSGTIMGNKSRIPKMKLKSFEIDFPTASFLDSISTKNARNFKDRNGSIGAGILSRFIVWFDYPHRKIMLKKNNYFKKSFDYNMSGLDIIYNGKQLIKEVETANYSDSFGDNVATKNNSIAFITSFTYKFKPSYKVKEVIKHSPAELAGIRNDDIILRINNVAIHTLKLGDIYAKLRSKDGKKIKMLIERAGEKMNFEFRLKRKI